MILLSWHRLIIYRCSWVLRDGGDADFSWIRDVLVGTVDGFSKKSEGNSTDMDFRGDFS